VVETWPGGWKLAASRTFLDADEEMLAHGPRPLKFMRRFAPFLARRVVANYRFNLFKQVAPSAES
jgi:hypothetical protein